MKTKLSPKLFLATSAIALGIATSALAMPFGGHGMDDGGRSGQHMMFGSKGMTRLHDDLKLDAKQEAAWQQADKASKDAMVAIDRNGDVFRVVLERLAQPVDEDVPVA